MKSLTGKLRIFVLAGVAALCMQTSAQVISGVSSDAALIAAIGANAELIGGKLNKSISLQTSTLTQNVLISKYLNDIDKYEKKMYDYMSEAQGIVTEAFTIKKCIDLGSEIIEALGACRKAAFEHPDGALCTELVNGQFSTVIQESAALVAYLAPIVQGDGDSNLLNSAERIRILNNVHSRLYALCCDIHSLHYNISCMRWGYIAKQLADDIYYGWLDEKSVYDKNAEYINGLISRLP